MIDLSRNRLPGRLFSLTLKGVISVLALIYIGGGLALHFKRKILKTKQPGV